MQPEVVELKTKLKEILYDCAVDVRATKAALYLFDGTSRFEMVTEYGFKGLVRLAVDARDPLVDRCGRGRTPFYVNGVTAEPRFSELLFESSTDRLLAAPLYSRGKLIGFIDMRDKAARQPFELKDLPAAQAIADRIVSLFSNMNIFGHRFITLSNLGADSSGGGPSELDAGGRANAAEPPVREKPLAAPPLAAVAAAPAASPGPAAPLPPSPREPPRPAGPRVAALVLEARNVAGRIAAAPATSSEALGEAEVKAAREVLRTVLLISDAVAAMFTAFGHLGGVQEIASRSPLTEDAKNTLQSKLNVWLSRRGDSGGFVKTSTQVPFGTSGPAIDSSQLKKVFTAPLAIGSLRGLYLTVAFSGVPDRVAHELLAALHSQLQMVVEQSMHRGTIGSLRSRIAERLVEPDLSKYPLLRRHSEAVAKLSESFARFLALSAAEAENARITGLVHDAGMRLLDHDRLYRKRDLTAEELGFLREHAAVGAALVDPLLGSEISRAVLCHHERVDGRGYPNELQEDEIPLLSRIVQICDAFVAITDLDTYQVPESTEAALASIARGAGSQFDAALAGRFVEMVRTRAY